MVPTLGLRHPWVSLPLEGKSHTTGIDWGLGQAIYLDQGHCGVGICGGQGVGGSVQTNGNKDTWNRPRGSSRASSSHPQTPPKPPTTPTSSVAITWAPCCHSREKHLPATCHSTDLIPFRRKTSQKVIRLHSCEGRPLEEHVQGWEKPQEKRALRNAGCFLVEGFLPHP